MPRRNHHNTRPAPDTDRLAATLTRLAAALAVSDGKFACSGCRRRGHWNGDHCPACTGRIILNSPAYATGR